MIGDEEPSRPPGHFPARLRPGIGEMDVDYVGLQLFQFFRKPEKEIRAVEVKASGQPDDAHAANIFLNCFAFVVADQNGKIAKRGEPFRESLEISFDAPLIGPVVFSDVDDAHRKKPLLKGLFFF
jgi:hypothetical protein